MRRVTFYFITALFFISCNKETPEKLDSKQCLETIEWCREEQALSALEGSWKQINVTQDGQPPQQAVKTNPIIRFWPDYVHHMSNIYAIEQGNYILPNTRSQTWYFVERTNFQVIESGDFTFSHSWNEDSTLLILKKPVEPTTIDSLEAVKPIVSFYIMTFERTEH